MKKTLYMLFCFSVVVNIVFAQDIFLTLTKNESVEKLPTNITIILHEKIESKHAETLGELLRSEAGIDFRSNGTTGAVASIMIRGASSTQTLVLIDGRRINDVGLGGVDFTSIPVSIIEKVEIIRGAGTSIYGTSAFGGVVNVITKKAVETSPLFEGDISYGSFNSISPVLSIAYTGGKYAGFASLSNISSDGNRDNSNFTNINSFFSGQYNMSDVSKLSLTGNIYGSKYGVPGSMSYPTLQNNQKDSNKYIQFDYNYNFDRTVRFFNIRGYISNNIRYFHDNMENSYYNVVAVFKDGKYKYNSDTCGINVDFHSQNNILVGLALESDSYKQNGSLSCYKLNKSRKNCAAYAQFNFPVNKFTLMPAIRYDNNSQIGYIFTPSLSTVFNASETIKISANTGKVWRAPVFAELYWNQQSTSLKSEHGISSDCGIEYAYNKTRVMGSFYYIKSRDLIAWNYYTTENIGKARQYGFEFEAGYIMTSFFKCELNYTYLKAKNEKTQKVLNYRPANTINYCVTVKPMMENLSIAVNLFYRSKVFISDTNTEELDDFATLNIDLNYKINDNLSLWAKGVNICNTKYEFSKDYPMPGVAVCMGINMKVFR